MRIFSFCFCVLIVFTLNNTSIAGKCHTAYEKYRQDNIDIFHNVYTGRLERRCRYYSSELLEKFGRNGNFRVSNAYYREVLNDQNHFDRPLISKFVEYCLPSYKDTSFDSFSSFVSDLSSRIVVVFGKDGDLNMPLCTGFLMSKGIFTARHCFVEGFAKNTVETPLGKCKAHTIVDIEKYKYYLVGKGDFMTVNGSQVEVPQFYHSAPDSVCKKTYLENAIDKKIAQSDWIYLEADVADIDGQLSAISEGTFTSNEHTQNLFVGFSKLKYLLGITGPNKVDLRSAIDNSLYIDIGFTCRPFLTEESLFFHGCSTMSVASGSPIFEFNNDVPISEWRLFGINTGTSAFTAMCSRDDLEQLTPNDGNLINGGVIPPQNLIDP